MSLIDKRVEDIRPGDLVGLESCPYLKGERVASELYAEVSLVQEESEDCILIAYEDIDHVGYPRGTVD